MANYFSLGFGVTPEKPNSQEGDPDDKTFNVGEHSFVIFEVIENDDYEILVSSFPDGNVKIFDDDYDAAQYIAEACINNKEFENVIKPLDKDTFLSLYDSLRNGEVSEEDEGYIEEQLGCTFEISEGYLETDSEHGSCLFGYLVTDTLDAEVKFDGNKILIAGEEVGVDRIGDHNSRQYEDQTTVAVSSRPVM